MRKALLLERKRRLEEAKNKKEIKIKKKRYSPRFCTICDEDKSNHKRKLNATKNHPSPKFHYKTFRPISCFEVDIAPKKCFIIEFSTNRRLTILYLFYS